MWTGTTNGPSARAVITIQKPHLQKLSMFLSNNPGKMHKHLHYHAQALICLLIWHTINQKISAHLETEQVLGSGQLTYICDFILVWLQCKMIAFSYSFAFVFSSQSLFRQVYVSTSISFELEKGVFVAKTLKTYHNLTNWDTSVKFCDCQGSAAAVHVTSIIKFTCSVALFS